MVLQKSVFEMIMQYVRDLHISCSDNQDLGNVFIGEKIVTLQMYFDNVIDYAKDIFDHRPKKTAILGLSLHDLKSRDVIRLRYDNVLLMVHLKSHSWKNRIATWIHRARYANWLIARHLTFKNEFTKNISRRVFPLIPIYCC